MWIDLVCAIAIALFMLLGYFSGFWMQLMRLLALAGAFLLAGMVGGLIASPVANGLSIPAIAGYIVGTVIAFTLLYILLSTIGWLIVRKLRRKRNGVSLDGIGGVLFSGAKVAVLLTFGLSALVLLEHPLEVQLAKMGWKDSWAAAKARDYNLLGKIKLPLVGNLETLEKLSRDRKLQQKALEDPAVKRLARHPKVRRLMNDPKLRKAIDNQEYSRVLADKRIDELMRDPEIRKLVDQIDLSKLARR